jgi:hypothetical protein
MGDYLSPVLEGFADLDPVFSDMLTSTNISGGTATTSAKVDALKEIFQRQQDLADSLMISAKKIGSVSQVNTIKEKAYDAAFESDITAPLPTSTATLQGFTLLFFIISFLSLAIVFSIHINHITNNTMYAVYTFIGFLVLFILAIALIIRLA